MLALQLTYGIREIPRFWCLQLTSQDQIEEYLNSIFDHPSPVDGVSNHGKSFIRKCLVYDDEKRLTAHAALNHCWLQEPEADNQLFQKLERESTSSWVPRGIVLPVIEKIGQVTNVGNHEEEPSQTTDDTSTQSRSVCDTFPPLKTTTSSSRFFTSQEVENRQQAIVSQDGWVGPGVV